MSLNRRLIEKETGRTCGEEETDAVERCRDTEIIGGRKPHLPAPKRLPDVLPADFLHLADGGAVRTLAPPMRQECQNVESFDQLGFIIHHPGSLLFSQESGSGR